jgi:hypothetical protein
MLPIDARSLALVAHVGILAGLSFGLIVAPDSAGVPIFFALMALGTLLAKHQSAAWLSVASAGLALFWALLDLSLGRHAPVMISAGVFIAALLALGTGLRLVRQARTDHPKP